MVFQHIVIPPDGAKIQITESSIKVPQNPIILFIEGDGIGSDITRAMKHVVDAAVARSYLNERRIVWSEIYAGDKALQLYGNYLPDETIDAIKTYAIAIKGPLTTPISGGIRSLNVIMRQVLDLYQCIRPCKDYGAPSPVKHPEKMDLVIFRENTEDVYAGVEYKSGTLEATKLQKFLEDELHVKISPDSGIGIKLISSFRSKRLVRAAIQYALKHHYRTVTLVHKGNIMKFTEGAFRDWGYQVATEEFGDKTYTEDDLEKKYSGKRPDGKILINDRIADNTFQQILLRTDEYEVLACPNLNGDYLSDAAAAQVGGLGMAPGANIGDKCAIFEATHGTAPKYTNQDKVNPSSLILSAAMMLEYIGWQEAADLIKVSLKKTIQQHFVTYDLARQFEEKITPISTSKMAEIIINNFSI